MRYNLILCTNLLIFFCLHQNAFASTDTITMKYKLDFYTEYNQFYINDQGSNEDIDLSDFWNPKAYAARLALGEDILGIGIQCYGHVKGELEILETRPNITEYNQYDHVVEAGIKSKTGILQVVNCPYSTVELKFKVKPGVYKVRIYSSNLLGVDIDESEGDDYYRIEIWPDKDMERKVIKQYIPSK